MARSGKHMRLYRLGMYGLVLILAGGLFACQTAPITGRKQLILLSTAEENRMGITAFRQILEKEPLSTDPKANALVRRVGQRLAAVVQRPDFAWEFRVIDKDIANAFALPGGKVAVYTGILRYTQTEAGLATVLAHEIAHVLARHGGERMSRSLLAQLGFAALQIGLRNGDPVITRGIALAYGLGVELPFSRQQESEADHIGLILMAKAGYDPREAVAFWQRMLAGKQGKEPPEFLSTHPAGTTRIRQLRQWMPEALSYYRRVSQGHRP